MIPNTRIQPLKHDSYDAEHFVALCRREMELYPRSPIADHEPHEVVMDPSTPVFLRRQAA